MTVGPFGSGAFGTGVFSNSPFYDTKGLIDAILRDTGHSQPSNETNKRNVVLDFINNRYAIITTSQHWDWLYQEVDTLFKEPYETGTVALTKASQSVTGTGTAWSSNIVPNNVLAITSRDETYLINAVSSQTTIALEGQYAGDTESGISYKIIKPIYTLPSDLEHVQAIQIDGVSRKMVPLGRQEFTRVKQHDPCRTGTPLYFTEVGRTASDGTRLLEIYPAPDKHYTARLHYGVNIMKLVDEADNYPLVPDRHRAVLYYGGLTDMYRYLRDATMSSQTEELFQLSLLNMRNDKQITDSTVQLQPKRNYRNRSGARRRYRISYTASDFSRED